MLAEDDKIYAVPADVVMRLDLFISETAKRVMAQSVYKFFVATVCDSVTPRSHFRILWPHFSLPSGAVLAPVL